MNTDTATARISLRDAYRKGWNSGRTNVESDEAVVRFTKKYCAHPTYKGICDLCRAWWNGFALSQYATCVMHTDPATGHIITTATPLRSEPAYQHGITCALGIAAPDGHDHCEWA